MPICSICFRLTILLLTFMAVSLIASSNCDAQQWGRFRGPHGNGVVDCPIPTNWSETKNITWQAQVPGRGHSSPLIGDGKVWLTTGITTALTAEQKTEKLSKLKDPNGLELVGKLSQRVIAYDFQRGRVLHDIELFQTDSPEPIHLTNTYASPTPVLHSGRLYAHFGTYGTACIDASTGKILWRFNDLKVDHQNGPGSSPIVWEDLLIIHFDGTDRQCIVALKLEDGTLAWRTDRSGEMHPTPELQKAYCTPTVVKSERGWELISPAANWVYGYNPRDGSELWKAHYGELGFSTVPCPVVGHGMAFICTSFMKSRLLAVRYGGQGDVTDSHIVWKSDSNISQKPSLALVNDSIYVISDAGILTCLDAMTGEEIYRQRIGGKYAASPLIVGDLIYFFSQEGKTTIVQAGKEYKEIAVNELDGAINASPAAADNVLLIRSDTHLYRIDAEKDVGK